MTDLAKLALEADTRGLRKGSNDLKNIARQSRDTANTVDRSASKMGGALSRVRGSIVPLVASFAGAAFSVQSLVRINAQFGASMQKVAAISGATGADLEELRQTAKDLGATTEFSASQAADGLTFLAQAGFTAQESIAAIPSVLSLATAGSLELGSAADIASNVLSGFGKQAGEAGIVADVLASAASSTNTSVSQLGRAMSTVAPIAASLGISMEETAAAIGVMSDAGIQGERAGTALRGVFASLAGPTEQAKEALAQYGIAASDVDPQTVGLSNALGLLAEKGVSTADAMTIFGREAASGALVVADASQRVNELTEQFQNAGGAADAMAKIMADNLNGDINALRSAFEGLIISLGDGGASGSFRALAQTATAALRLINDNLLLVTTTLASGVAGLTAYKLASFTAARATALMSTNFGVFVGLVSSTTRQVGLLAGAKVALGAATTGATAAMRSLTGAFLANPFTAVATAVAILASAFIGLANAQRQARSETDNLIRSLNAASKASAKTFAESDLGSQAEARLDALRKAIREERKILNKPVNRRGAAIARRISQRRIGQLSKELANLEVATRKARWQFDETNRSVAEIAVPAATSAAAIKSNAAAVQNLGSSVVQTAPAIDTLGNALDGLQQRLFPIRAIIADYRDDQALLKKAHDAGRISTDQHAQAVARLTAEFVRNGRVFDQGQAPSVLSGDDSIVVDAREVGKELDILVNRSQDGTGKIASSFGEMANSITNSLQSLSNSIRSGNFLDILGGVIGTFTQLAGSGLFGSSLKTAVSGGTSSISSFDGGGFTGSGPRSGGMDGKGGFLAMLHPNETVTDHTRGRGAAAPVTAIINNSPFVEVYIDDRIANAAPAIANAGAAVAQNRQSRRRRRAVPR